MSLFLPIAIALIGLLIWIFAGHPKASEAGRIMFFCGALVTTAMLSGTNVDLLPHGR